MLWALGTELSPVQKQLVLLTAERSLQHQMYHFYITAFVVLVRFVSSQSHVSQAACKLTV